MSLFKNVVVTWLALGLVACAGSGERGSNRDGFDMPDPPPSSMGGGAMSPTPPPPPTVSSGMDGGASMPMPSTPPAPSGACTIDVTDGLPPLPSACLPRCAATTMEAMRGCSDGACQRAALDRDTTMSTTLLMTAGGEEVDMAELTCSMCFNLMNNSCVNDVCGTELQAYVTCRGTGAGCEAESTAVASCLMRQDAPYRSCQGERIPLCFGG